MGKQDDEPEAGGAKSDLDRKKDEVSSISLSASSVEIDEKRPQPDQDHQQDATEDEKPRQHAEGADGGASAYSTDSTERGEPDFAHEEVEEVVPGHELDLQLSRVGFHPVGFIRVGASGLTSVPASFPGPRHREPAEDRDTRQHQVQGLARHLGRVRALPHPGRRGHQARPAAADQPRRGHRGLGGPGGPADAPELRALPQVAARRPALDHHARHALRLVHPVARHLVADGRVWRGAADRRLHDRQHLPARLRRRAHGHGAHERDLRPEAGADGRQRLLLLLAGRVCAGPRHQHAHRV